MQFRNNRSALADYGRRRLYLLSKSYRRRFNSRYCTDARRDSTLQIKNLREKCIEIYQLKLLILARKTKFLRFDNDIPIL